MSISTTSANAAFDNLDIYKNVGHTQVKGQLPTDNSKTDPSTEDTQDKNSADTKVEPTSNENTDNTDWRKRYGDQQNYVASLKNRIKELETVHDEPKLPKSEEELETFKAKFPDWFDFIVSIARKETSEKKKLIDQELDELKGQAAQADYRRNLNKVLTVHSDAETLLNNSELHGWVSSQSQGIQMLFDSPDPNDWIEGLNIYKRSKGIKDTKSAKQEAAAAINTKSVNDEATGQKKIWKRSEIKAMTYKELEKYKPELHLAMKEGRVIKD